MNWKIFKIFFCILVVNVMFGYIEGAFVPIEKVKLYEKPDEDSYIVAYITEDVIVNHIDRTNRFFYVEADGNLGWILRAKLKEYDPKDFIERVQRVTFPSKTLIYRSRDTLSRVIAKIDKNTHLYQVKDYLDWRKIVLEDGTIGWVKKNKLVNYDPKKHEKSKTELLKEYKDFLSDDNKKLETSKQTKYGYRPIR